ncbi:MAG TPA: hypothetical protein DE314_04135, partial [Sulfitobacter sp.]|nr:hypothetical protein [Sulfitobacter sp.]
VWRRENDVLPWVVKRLNP